MAFGIAVSVSVAVFLYQVWAKQRLVELGKRRQEHEGRRVRAAQEGLGGIKDVKALNREKFFISHFTDQALGLASVQQSQYVYQQLPKIWVELFAVAGLVGSIYFLLDSSRSTNEDLPPLASLQPQRFELSPL